MALSKDESSLSAVGLHLTAAAGDGVLTYSDVIADTNYVHVKSTQTVGGFQNAINKELRNALVNETDWEEYK